MRRLLIAMVLAALFYSSVETGATEDTSSGITKGASTASLQDRLLCPAELLVIRADAKRLQLVSTTDAERRGLRNRIRAALATLPWLCRRYTAASSTDTKPREDFHQRVRELNVLFTQAEAFELSLDRLIDAAPLSLDSFRFDREGDADEKDLGAIYQSYCHGCHSNTDYASENPAYPLNTMARERDEAEFFARMLLGVRGTAETGLANPLSPIEIGAMTRYLLSQK